MIFSDTTVTVLLFFLNKLNVFKKPYTEVHNNDLQTTET